MMRLVLAAALLCWSGCYVSAQVQSAERTFRPEVIEGAGVAGQRLDLTRELALDLSSSVRKLITRLSLTRLRIAPTSGVAKLDFIDDLHITAQGEGALRDAEIATFVRGTPLTSDGAIDVEGNGVDLVPYVMLNKPFVLTADLTSPAQTWSFTVTLEFQAESDGKIEL